MNRQVYGQTFRMTQTEGWADRRMDRQKDGQTEGCTEIWTEI